MANPGVDNLDPRFYRQLLAFVQASNGLVTLEGGSGWRSIERQAQLYADWKAGRHKAPSVAKPGRSQHNFGLAFDLKFPGGARGVRWAQENAGRFGLHFPVEGEYWHAEPIWGRQASSGRAPVTSVTADLGPQTVSPAQARDRAKELYGYLGWYVDHPEIGSILIEAAMHGWDPARLQGRLAQTKWWKNTSESARQWDALVISDNATAARRIKETNLSFALEANRLGVPIDKNRLYAMSVQALRHGWNEDEQRLALAAELRWRPDKAPTGAVAQMMGDVRTVAADHMVSVTDRQAFEWSKRIAGGVSTMDAVTQQMRLLAAARFPHLADEIGQGVTPAQFFTPYRNTIAQVLEVTPDEVDLMSNEWAPVVSYADPRTGETRPMTFAEAERYARSRPGWSHTANAWETGSQAADALMQIFGKVA